MTLSRLLLRITKFLSKKATPVYSFTSILLQWLFRCYSVSLGEERSCFGIGSVRVQACDCVHVYARAYARVCVLGC